MVNVRVARRYAEALAEMAEEQKYVGVIAQDLELLRRAVRESRDFLLFLKSPIINNARKQEILLGLFTDKTSKVTQEFLHILVEKGREYLLPDIIEQFFAIRDERMGIINAEVKGVGEFSPDQTTALQRKLEVFSGKKVRISFSVDKHLVGGFIARVGDTVFDGSIRRQLELLRERFAEGNGIN
ncbi:MAG TPA: ATP synthase F1 subunit delta [Bacteroidota bacterium]